MIRRITATFLLLCMALSVPASASSLRVCFIEEAVLLPGWDATQASDSEKPKCCPDCDGKEDGSCCVDVKKLPDSPEAPTPAFLPPVLFYEIPLELNLPACLVAELKGVYQPFIPIRGPDSPGVLRARLSIWNI